MYLNRNARYGLGYALIILLVFARPAFGYIDGNVGALLIQLLVGSVLGGLLAIKLYWRRIKGWFGGSTRSAGDDIEESFSDTPAE